MMFSLRAPNAQSKSKQESAAAPAPETMIFMSSIFLLTICKAFNSAEPTMILVPC